MFKKIIISSIYFILKVSYRVEEIDFQIFFFKTKITKGNFGILEKKRALLSTN